jgi:hypothetical protein
MRDGIQLRGKIEDDLRSLTRDPAAEPLLKSCAPVYVPNHRPVPILAWYLDEDQDTFTSALIERPRRGLYVAPATSVEEEKFVLDPNAPARLRAVVPPGFTRVTSNDSWVLYAKGCS